MTYPRITMDALSFAQEAAAIIQNQPSSNSSNSTGCCCWTLEEFTDDVFETRVTYLVAEYPLSRRNNTHMMPSKDTDTHFDCEDDEEAAPREESSSSPSTSCLSSSIVTVRLYVSYSENYRLPQVHFEFFFSPSLSSMSSTSPPSSSCDRTNKVKIYLTIDEMISCGMSGICDAERDGSALIVSLGFCEELERTLYSVHQCDTENLLRAAIVEMGVTHHRGSLLRLFLMMIGPMLGAPASLTHETVQIKST